MKSLVVGAAQIACRPGDIGGNVALHCAAIAAARRQDVEVLVFPELSLTDYLSEPDIAALARSAEAPELRAIAQEAGPMIVSVGFIERGEDGACYNAQGLLSQGRGLAVHRKANLPTYGQLHETRYYAKGTRIAPTRLHQDWTAATLICADTWNPALPWLAALQGATLLLVPVASARDAVGDDFDNPAGWDVNLRHTALTYGLPTVMANHCGERGAQRFWGSSRILDASGRTLVRLGEDPGLAVARLEAAEGMAARARLPTVRDADPALIAAELNRIIGA